MSTPSKQQLCGLKGYLDPSGCARSLERIVEHYNRVGRQVLNNARNTWSISWPRDLPIDVAELFQGWYLPDFKSLEIDNMPLTNVCLTSLVAQWHLKLFTVLDRFCQEETRRRVLSGFNVVNDLLFYLTNDTEFQRFWNALGNPAPGRCPPDRNPQNVNDALACLIDTINDPSKQGKFYPDPATLNTILNAAQQAGLSQDRFLGGAAGNMAYVLSQMGVEVHIHCPYHSGQLRWNELDPSARYLEFNHNRYQSIPADPGDPNLPCKITVGFQSAPGWSFSQLNIQATQPGRALFIGRHPTLNPQHRQWNDVEVNWQGQNYPWNGPWQNDREVWPHPTVLGSWRVNGQTLEIIPADDALVTQLAQGERYDVALLKDVGALLRCNELEQARKTQLDELRRSQIPIHVEISPRFNFAFLRHLISNSPFGNASYWSAGLNPDELLDITDQGMQPSNYNNFQVDPYLFPKSTVRESLLQRFVRGLHLLKLLKLDWIYVHGNELDIAIWRKEACDQIEQLGTNTGGKLRDAMLLAKAAVVAAMIVREPSPRLQQLINSRLAQGSALAVKGFWALLSFAQQFSEWTANRYGSSKQNVYQDLLDNGFYELGNDFGVAVAPVFWPDEVQFLNATGAGDYSSAVVAAYVWGS